MYMKEYKTNRAQQTAQNKQTCLLTQALSDMRVSERTASDDTKINRGGEKGFVQEGYQWAVI